MLFRQSGGWLLVVTEGIYSLLLSSLTKKTLFLTFPQSIFPVHEK